MGGDSGREAKAWGGRRCSCIPRKPSNTREASHLQTPSEHSSSTTPERRAPTSSPKVATIRITAKLSPKHSQATIPTPSACLGSIHSNRPQLVESTLSPHTHTHTRTHTHRHTHTHIHTHTHRHTHTQINT